MQSHSSQTFPGTLNVAAGPWLLLFGRTVLFLAIQLVFTLAPTLLGRAPAWEAAQAGWPLTVTLANLICLAALVGLFRAEGKNYWHIFRLQRQHLKSDLLALLGVLVITGPVSYLPNILLAIALFSDPQASLHYLVRPLPLWAALASLVLFPVTQGLVELPLYFAYVMPRLSARRFPDLRPVVLPALMLGLQHLAIPFVFDWRYIAWRGLMFIPFAFLAGIVLYGRPRLLPYMVVIHILMDMAFAAMLLPVAY